MKRILPFAVMMVAAACSDRAAPFAPAAESESVLLASRIAAAKEAKVAVCHVNGTGNYKLISVSGNALSAHLAHGDGLPGENGLGADCSVAAGDPFAFVSVDTVFAEESFYHIVWTVEGTPSAATFDVEIFIPDVLGEDGSWSSQETVEGSSATSYESLSLYGAGDYRIVARLSDGSVLATSATVTIGTPLPPPPPPPPPASPLPPPPIFL